MTSPDTGTTSLLDRLRLATLGRYDIYAELGSGGMATVFLARDLSLDRKVAIKVMSPALTSTPDSIERFRREARVAAQLSHPHIIPIHAIGEEPGLAYYVMKYLEGRTLDSVLRDEGAQSIPFVRTVLTEIGNALHYAHQRGVVHRDIKPANIMLDTDGWLVVTDFGIAKRDDIAGLTQSGTIIGTPFYMSPEQFNGQPVTGAADQYALGIVAYELLVGRTPFGGPSLGEVMKGHLLDPVPSLATERPDVPADLAAAIMRMLDKDPAARFPTLAEAVHAIGNVTKEDEREMRTHVIQLAKTGAMAQPRMAVPASPAVQPRPSTRPSTWPSTQPMAQVKTTVVTPPPAKKRRWLAMAAVVVLLLAGAGVVNSIVKGRANSGANRDAGADAKSGAPRGADPSATGAAPTVDGSTAPRGSADRGNASGSEVPVSPPPTTPTQEPQPASDPGDEIVAAAESVGSAATKAVKDSLAGAARALRDRILGGGGNRRQQLDAATEANPALATLGLIRIGSRTPRVTLQVNDRAPRPLGRQAVGLPMPAGPVRLILRAPRCAPFDTTVQVVAKQQIQIGMRDLRCR